MAQNVGSSPNFGGKKDALSPNLMLIKFIAVFNLLADADLYANTDVTVTALSLV